MLADVATSTAVKSVTVNRAELRGLASQEINTAGMYPSRLDTYTASTTEKMLFPE